MRRSNLTASIVIGAFLLAFYYAARKHSFSYDAFRAAYAAPHSGLTVSTAIAGTTSSAAPTDITTDNTIITESPAPDASATSTEGMVLTATTFPSATPTPRPAPLVRPDFPKKIWQIWRDDSDDPTERTVGLPRLWRSMNPGYRYERITHDNGNAYVQEKVPEELGKTFLNCKDHILRADLLRYLILYSEGGVWADIDTKPHQPVDKWIPEQFRNQTNLVIGIEADHHGPPVNARLRYTVQFAQFLMFAKPNHPTIKTLIDQVNANIERHLLDHDSTKVITADDVFEISGPFIFTNIVMEYLAGIEGKEYTGTEFTKLAEPRMIGDVLVLPHDSFGWLRHAPEHDESDPILLAEHLFIGSWRDEHPNE